MLNQTYVEMLKEKDIIFEIFEYANRRRSEVGGENVFDFSLGNPSVPAPEELNTIISRVLSSDEGASLHGYSPAGGLPQVREAVAADLKRRFCLPYRAEDIFMCCGAAAALTHALRAVSRPGDEILSFAPCFSEYQSYVRGAGCKLKTIPPVRENFQPDIDRAEEMINENTGAVLINSPNNPSGAVYTREKLKDLAELLERKSTEYGHRIYLISDEPYRDILFEGVDSPYVSAIYPHTLCCYSYSKSLSLPGERIGYLAITPGCEEGRLIMEMLPQISRTTGHNGAPVLWQRVVASCGGLTSDMGIYERNKMRLCEALREYGYELTEPGGGFYMFPRSPITDAKAFCKMAMSHDLMLVPGDGFGCPGHFRIAFCVDEEMAERALPVFKELIKPRQ